MTVGRYADMRYAGQAYELPVAVSRGAIDVEHLVADFVAEHVRTYGHGSADDPVDVVSIRAIARIERTAAQLYDPVAAIRALPVHEGTRLAYFGPDVGLVDTERATVPASSRASGAGRSSSTRPTRRASSRRAAWRRLDQFGNIEVELVV